MKLIFQIFCFFFCVQYVVAQGSFERWKIGAAPTFGFLVPHHSEIAYLINGHVKALDVEISKVPDGSKPWHHYFNFPEWGFTFSAYDLASPLLGKAASGNIFFDLPMNRQRSYGLKLGIGLGLFEKPYDQDDNIFNAAIGSRLNSALRIELFGNIGIGDHFTLKPGLGIHHFSNGALKVPNSGLNLAMFKLLLLYNRKTIAIPERLSPEYNKGKGEWRVGISAGMKQTYPIGGPEYPVFNAYGFWQIRISPKSSLGGELGLNYNQSLEHRITEDGSSSGHVGDNFRTYVAAIYQLHFEPFGIRFQAGSYIAPKFTEDGLIFLKYHLLYNLKRYQIFIGLKSHYARADHGELGIAYRIK